MGVGAQRFPPFKRWGHEKFNPVLKGGGAQKVLDVRFPMTRAIGTITQEGKNIEYFVTKIVKV